MKKKEDEPKIPTISDRKEWDDEWDSVGHWETYSIKYADALGTEKEGIIIGIQPRSYKVYPMKDFRKRFRDKLPDAILIPVDSSEILSIVLQVKDVKEEVLFKREVEKGESDDS